MTRVTPAERASPRRRAPWVIKLGGSLAGSPLLSRWLDVIAGGGGRLVLVPGGGPFADAVRIAQARWHFADGAAHRMAMLAMEQYGLMLAALEPRLRPCSSRADIRRTLGDGRVPVWLPAGMATGRPEIPESWDVTSDSLAAWLAAEIGAAGLVLVKSVAVADGAPVAELVRSGTVDPLLPRFLAAVPACRCIEAGRHAEMEAALRAGTMAGAEIFIRPGATGTGPANCSAAGAC